MAHNSQSATTPSFTDNWLNEEINRILALAAQYSIDFPFSTELEHDLNSYFNDLTSSLKIEYVYPAHSPRQKKLRLKNNQLFARSFKTEWPPWLPQINIDQPKIDCLFCISNFTYDDTNVYANVEILAKVSNIPYEYRPKHSVNFNKKVTLQSVITILNQLI